MQLQPVAAKPQNVPDQPANQACSQLIVIGPCVFSCGTHARRMSLRACRKLLDDTNETLDMNIRLHPISPAGCVDRVQFSHSLFNACATIMNAHQRLSGCATAELTSSVDDRGNIEWVLLVCNNLHRSQLPYHRWSDLLSERSLKKIHSAGLIMANALGTRLGEQESRLKI